MPLPLTLFEYDTEPFDWNDYHLSALERLNQAAGDTLLRATVRDGRRVLQAGSWVGVVRFGNQPVQILPKIYRNSGQGKADAARQATRNLLHLLAYARDVPIREQAIASLLRRNSDWFEILTRLFATHLREEWHRGAVRRYETCEDELPTLRGKWRVAEQLRRPERKHVFAVAFDEFTPDNALNRVFRFVVERLWHMTRDSDNRRLLGELRITLEDVTLLPFITSVQANTVALTRLNRRYEPLLNLARLFLDDGAFQLTYGDRETFAFAFDMNRLFESFVGGFLRRHRDEILPPALQSCRMLPQTRGAERWLARTASGQPVFKLKPDLAFCLDDANTSTAPIFPLLIDTKYKQLKPDDAKLGIAQSDLYQMFAYAHRYDCPRILLLYPQTATMPEPLRRRFFLSDTPTRSITAATIDLRGDLASLAFRSELTNRLQILLGDSQ